MDHQDQWEFDHATPARAEPGLLAALVCGALGCVFVGALIGVYFGMNQVSLF